MQLRGDNEASVPWIQSRRGPRSDALVRLLALSNRPVVGIPKSLQRSVCVLNSTADCSSSLVPAESDVLANLVNARPHVPWQEMLNKPGEACVPPFYVRARARHSQMSLCPRTCLGYF